MTQVICDEWCDDNDYDDDGDDEQCDWLLWGAGIVLHNSNFYDSCDCVEHLSLCHDSLIINLSIHEWYAYHCASVYHNHTFLTIGENFNTVFPVCMLECAHACVYECMSTLRAYVALADCYHSINFASYVTVTCSIFI